MIKKLIKRSFALFTALATMLTILCVYRAPASALTEAETIAAIARKEVGYYEGYNNYSKYGEYFGRPNVPWCCAFVVWCARQTEVATDVIPSDILSCTMLRKWYQERNLYYSSKAYGGTYTPRVGDIIFFSWDYDPGDPDHVGLVIAVNGNSVTCVEGNCPDRVREIDRSQTSGTVIGFASPRYKGQSTVDPSNAGGYKPGIYKITDKLNFRAAATTSSTSYSQIPAGTQVTVTDISGVWGKIEYMGKTGWICLQYASLLEAASENTEPDPGAETGESPFKTGKYQFNEDMRFRSGPGTSYSQITMVPTGTTLEITETKGEWGKTVYSGYTGWINLGWSNYLGGEQEPQQQPETPSENTYATGKYILGITMNFREKATTDSEIIGSIPAAAIVDVTEVSGVWGKVSYGGKTGWMSLEWSSVYSANPHGTDWTVIDVSQWNKPEDIDYATLKASGVQAVIIRIAGTYTNTKNTYTDESFAAHYAAAKAAGLHIGVYYFSYAMTAEKAKEEAMLTVSLLRQNNVQPDFPVFIDMEDYTGDRQHVAAGKTVCTQVVDAFCKTVEAAGYYSGVYSSTSFAHDLIDNSVMKGRGVWIAHYAAQCGYKYDYDMWQYTKTGRINGYNGMIDLSRCYTDFPALITGNPSQNETTTEGDTTPTYHVLPPASSTNESSTSGQVEPVEWREKTGPSCTSDGISVCCSGSTEIQFTSIPAAHSGKTVRCVAASEDASDTDFSINAGEKLTPDIIEKYTLDSSKLSSVMSSGGCVFSYCPSCYEVLEVKIFIKSCSSHSLAPAVTVTEATCDSEGLRTRSCKKCKKTVQQEIIPRTAHTESAVHSFVESSKGVYSYCTLCSVCSAPYMGVSSLPLGDVNTDHKISAEDARLLLRAAVGIEKIRDEMVFIADIDGDSKLTAADARLCLRASVGLTG